MKKIIFAFSLLFMLSSCSVQPKMNAEIFTDRLIENYKNEIVINDIFYYDDRCAIFFISENESECQIELFSDLNKNIYKITLTAEISIEKFCLLTEMITETYSPDIVFEININKLFENSFSCAETQWYYISAAKDKNILFFSIENKKLSPEKNTQLTLKNNDEI